jgi:hypothetical protein
MTLLSRSVPLWTVCVLLFLTGCRATQVEHDGKTFRLALLDMYTDQAMDNLIRAHDYKPFMQLTYRDLLVQDTDTVFGELSNTQATTHGKQFNVAAPLTAAFTRTILSTFGVRGSAQRQGQMSFHAEVVTESNDVYEKYMSFAHNPALFMVSDKKPTCPVHLMRKEGGKYYFIPEGAAPVFQDLVMKTTFLRGPETVPPGYYRVKVVGVSKVEAVGRNDLINATLQFDQTVPNGTGTLVLTLATGRSIQLTLYPESTTDKGPPPDLGQPVNRLDAQWNPKSPQTSVSPNDLIGATGRFFSHDFPATAPASSSLAQQVRDDLDRVRAAQANLMTIPTQ